MLLKHRDFCLFKLELVISFLDFFFLESAWGVGPQGPSGPQVGAPDLWGPGPFWGPWGPSLFGALRALGPSGAPEPEGPQSLGPGTHDLYPN